MVSTRQMSSSSGAMSSSMEENQNLRPVVTRQSSCTSTTTTNVGNMSTTTSSSSILMSTNASTASQGVGVINTKAASTFTSARQTTQAFKSYSNATGSNVTTLVPHNGNGGCGRDHQDISITLLDLPEEVLYSILSYVGFKKIGQLRVVSEIIM